MRFLHPWRSVRGEVLAGMLMCVVGWPALAAAPADEARLAAADTGFAFGLVKELAREQPARNIFISPYSISTVLQMVCNGAAGSTRHEMASVLGTSELEPQALNRACKELDQSIRSTLQEERIRLESEIGRSKEILRQKQLDQQLSRAEQAEAKAEFEELEKTNPETAKPPESTE